MDKEIIETLITASIGLFLLLVLFYFFIWLRTRRYILSLEEVQATKYALVLGAGLEKNGEPSDILKDRVLKAARLYKANKAQYLIMSGSVMKGKDEPGAMQTMALSLGVPQSAILLDRNGISTFHSCTNLKSQFNPANVTIITQYFHLPRSLFFQRLLGIQAFGLPADIYKFAIYKKAYWLLREFFALPYNIGKYLIHFFLR